jgi:uncharacterized protein (DUF1499 family)
MTTASTSPASGSVWGPRLTKWSIRLTVAAVAVAGIGLTLARYDLIPKLAGFAGLVGGGLIALVALVVGIGALIAGRGGAAGGRGKLLAALAVSLVYVGFIASRPLVAGEVPAIHDVTTDLANPPQFEVLPLRADNLAGVGTVENWKTIHATSYSDLAPVTLAKPVAEATAQVAALAASKGWTVAKSDPARGHVEATASVSYVRFYDDVVIRITPSADGKGSVVNMRSVSRVGISDFGVNAKRVRAFLKDLAAE